jgi:exo-beta-1,3-glucanase (GH17 family)
MFYKIICCIFCFSIIIYAQNTKKAERAEDIKIQLKNVIDADIEAMRIKIVDGNDEILFRNDTVNTNWIDTISNFLGKPNFNDTFIEVHEGDFEADDTCDVSYTSDFISIKTFRYFPGKPVPLPMIKTSSYNNLYIKGVNGLVSYTLRLWGF